MGRSICATRPKLRTLTRKSQRALCQICVIFMSHLVTNMQLYMSVESLILMFNRRPSKLVYCLLCMLPLCFAVSLSYALSRQQLAPAVTSDYSNYQCTTGTHHTDKAFRILTLTVMDSVALANRLCAAPEVQADYARVEIIWHTRGFISARDIVEQHYDLFLNRPYLVAGLVPDYERYYRPLLTSAPYSVYWLARTSKPELTQAYFADKRVGLLDDFYSQSFFLLPSGSLRAANIQLHDDQKILFHDLSSLYSAFEAGAIDVITSPDLGAFSDKIDPLYNLEIAEQAPPISWFIRREAGSSKLHCAVQKILSNSINWMRDAHSDIAQECH